MPPAASPRGADPAAGEPPTPLAPALTVITIAKNAASTLARCLDSVAFAGAHVLLDSGSTDDTVALARARGCEVTETPDWPGFGPQKNRALDRARTPWVLSLDADEWIRPPLARAIAAIVSGDRSVTPGAGAAVDGYRIAERTWYRQRHLKGMGWWPGYNLRLFRRERGRFAPRLVHEVVEVTGRVATLPRELAIEHEPFRDLGAWIARNVRYASDGAAERRREGRRVSLLALSTKGPYRAFRDFVFRGGFLNGLAGLVISATNGFVELARDAMLYCEPEGPPPRSAPSRREPASPSPPADSPTADSRTAKENS